MGNEYVKGCASAMEFAISLCEKFLILCPPKVWEEKFGGFLVCNQFYHSLAATGHMITSVSGKPVADPVPDAMQLTNESHPTPTMENAKTMLLNVKEAFADMIANLDDADLLKKNEPISKRRGRTVTVGETIALMACHTLYHLGSCDAALRDDGLEGAF